MAIDADGNEYTTVYDQFLDAMGERPDWRTIVALLPQLEADSMCLEAAQQIEDHQGLVDPFTVEESHRCKMWANQTLRDAGRPHVTYYRSKWSR